MADKPPATTAHVTFSATRPVARERETIGFRCDPPEPGLVGRPGRTAIAATIVTSCTREARFLHRSQRKTCSTQAADTAADAQGPERGHSSPLTHTRSSATERRWTESFVLMAAHTEHPRSAHITGTAITLK
jgi:hypothetical protein